MVGSENENHFQYLRDYPVRGLFVNRHEEGNYQKSTGSNGKLKRATDCDVKTGSSTFWQSAIQSADGFWFLHESGGAASVW